MCSINDRVRSTLGKTHMSFQHNYIPLNRKPFNNVMTGCHVRKMQADYEFGFNIGS